MRAIALLPDTAPWANRAARLSGVRATIRRYRNWRRTVQRVVRSGNVNGDSAVQLSLDGGAEP